MFIGWKCISTVSGAKSQSITKLRRLRRNVPNRYFPFIEDVSDVGIEKSAEVNVSLSVSYE
jgi:hypothetical protein